jgi:hypothetical protein
MRRLAPGIGGRLADIPSAPPPHGTLLSWHQGCRCDECLASHQDFLRELELRARDHPVLSAPEPRRLSADERAHLEAAVRARACPRCGALQYHRCRNPHFPQHFAATHAERGSG